MEKRPERNISRMINVITHTIVGTPGAHITAVSHQMSQPSCKTPVLFSLIWLWGDQIWICLSVMKAFRTTKWMNINRTLIHLQNHSSFPPLIFWHFIKASRHTSLSSQTFLLLAVCRVMFPISVWSVFMMYPCPWFNLFIYTLTVRLVAIEHLYNMHDRDVQWSSTLKIHLKKLQMQYDASHPVVMQCDSMRFNSTQSHSMPYDAKQTIWCYAIQLW